MTQNCRGGDSGCRTRLSSPASSPSQRGRGAADTRNKCITDFFKPALKQDRTVLCSPEKGNGQAGHTVSCVDRLKKSISSPKQNRRKKLPCSPSSRSPIIDAFFRNVKSEKKNSPENGVYKILKAKHPEVVVRKLFISNEHDSSFLLKDHTFPKTLERNEKCPVQRRTPLIENSREHKTEHVDLDTTGSSLNKWPSTSENNNLNKQSQDTRDFLRKNSSSASLDSSSETGRISASAVPSEKFAEQLGSSLRDCDNVDNSDEEALIPLEQILSQGIRTAAKSSEEAMDQNEIEGTISATHNASLSKPVVECGVSFMNHLEHLLKEKEELRRVDELENQLQQVKGIAEINSPLEDQSTDGELSAEHREFIERYSFSHDAIPDQHPGENIFQIANAGKIFNQNNLDLRNFDFHPQNPIEQYLVRWGITQQLFVIIEGLLVSTYHNSSCPVPILKWMFQMMSIHPDSSLSRKILDMLMILTIRNVSDDNNQQKPWIPSLFDITAVLINMGSSFNVLFPLQKYQPSFTENNIMSKMHVTVRKQSNGDICINPTTFFLLIESNLCNIAKFLRLCITVCPEEYTDREIFMLLLLLFKLSLETELKQFPLVDLECLIIKLLENIRDWDTEKMSELSSAVSCLSNHHHNLLWLVQFVPNWTTRGRQIKRHLSLVIILKLLKNHVEIPSNHDEQMSLLCEELVKMKPSNLLKSLSETSEHHDGLKDPFLSQSEPQAYYLTYVLLHLVREASNSERTNSNQRKWLLKLCSTLEKHVKCDIREDVRLFYRTKVSLPFLFSPQKIHYLKILFCILKFLSTITAYLDQGIQILLWYLMLDSESFLPVPTFLGMVVDVKI
ncbi:SMC5-SMC6 complex localization factor protein 2 isoform 6-T7 [Liasis olivaceus]